MHSIEHYGKIIMQNGLFFICMYHVDFNHTDDSYTENI